MFHALFKPATTANRLALLHDLDHISTQGKQRTTRRLCRRRNAGAGSNQTGPFFVSSEPQAPRSPPSAHALPQFGLAPGHALQAHYRISQSDRRRLK